MYKGKLQKFTEEYPCYVNTYLYLPDLLCAYFSGANCTHTLSRPSWEEPDCVGLVGRGGEDGAGLPGVTPPIPGRVRCCFICTRGCMVVGWG